MTYQLLIISRIETDTRDQLVALTFYPANSACIRPRAYESLIASFVQHFTPGIGLAGMISQKGKPRLKVLMRQPNFSDDERRSLGTMYYSLLFCHKPGDDNKKGAADALYYTLCDLYKADASNEDSWAEACTAAVASIQRLAAQHVV